MHPRARVSAPASSSDIWRASSSSDSAESVACRTRGQSGVPRSARGARPPAPLDTLELGGARPADVERARARRERGPRVQLGRDLAGSRDPPSFPSPLSLLALAAATLFARVRGPLFFPERSGRVLNISAHEVWMGLQYRDSGSEM